MSALTHNERSALSRAERALAAAAPAIQAARRAGEKPSRETIQQIAEATAWTLALVESRFHDNALLATLEAWIGEERAC
ncbi:hypothetical protein [Kaistia nematophila]|uniref:Uncharacterized protein n=1 Tax=Kaistia nematophila TaxID=2994654 RepID=A0A9X3E8I9_9HYPH|nr:hypothetical protein [Kaistia nematophila]MCX5571453.1 hypothetical protein [Kaistia nematophila]